ncbi:MAG: GlsB/YeaQ/YmgE family stress response membrane protein [Beijerinckiaceae bacterium]
MDQQLGVLGTPGVSFVALVIIGGFAGWIAGMVTGRRHWLFTNILIGVCGSWLGSQFAQLAGVQLVGKWSHFLAALVGSIVILFIWQALHPQNQRGPGGPPN